MALVPLSYGAQQTIGVGASANDGTGDAGRTAFQKVNANFTELYSQAMPGVVLSTTAYPGLTSAALQSLSDAIPSGGGTMLIGPGTYVISAVVTLKSNTTVQCQPGATLQMVDAGAVIASHWVFANVNNTATVLTDSNIKIRDCAFNGNSATPSTGADGIRMVFVSDVEVTGNSFTGFGDATAFLGTTRTLIANNKATAKISNTCWDHWYAPSYFRVINNYCETHKHGIQITGTDTAQTSAGIATIGTLKDNDIVLYSAFGTGAGIYLNSGASSDTGAGSANITVSGGRISTSGLGASVGDCIKVAGSGSTNDWIIGVKCDNGFVYVGPADSLATSYPANIHVRDVSVNLTNTYADGAIQIKTGTSGVESSRITGGGYTYGINLIGAINQYAKNNSIVAGTDGTNPRTHTDGTSAATALIIDTDETAVAAAMTESALIYNAISYRSPKFILGTASNGFVQYGGSNKVYLDETDNGTGVVCFRTDSGAGLAERVCVLNAGTVTLNGKLLVSPAAPTVSSGFGTSPTISQNNGTASFSINVGTGGVATSGVIALPAAPHAWACTVADVTTPATNMTQQTAAASTTTVGFTNYVRTTGVAGAWTASDILQVSCWPN